MAEYSLVYLLLPTKLIITTMFHL